KLVSVSDVATLYLRKLRETAEGYLGTPVSGVVIAVPTHFSAKSTTALLAAARDAGFTHAHHIVEPVAAALAFDRAAAAPPKPDRTVLVADLGGHQFNVTVLSVNAGLYSVVASLDDYRLGGSHFDDVLVQYVRDEFRKKHRGRDFGENRRAVAKARAACEQTKRMLSQRDTAPCSVDSLFDGADFHAQLLRARFEHLAEPLFARCADLVRRALADAALAPHQVDEVLLVGGAARIPRFQAVLRAVFPDAASTALLRADVDPDEAIGCGAAIQATHILALDAANRPTIDYAAAAANPAVTAPPQLQRSLGIAAAGGAFVPVLPRRAPIPARRELQLAVASKGQREAYIAVYEGEDLAAAKNRLLAELVIDIPPGAEVSAAAGGAVVVDVVFIVEKDEVLTVEARERSKGVAVKVKVA
ncbi:Heat shock 70 kDa protein 6, partial [Cladochytrium tenue]